MAETGSVIAPNDEICRPHVQPHEAEFNVSALRQRYRYHLGCNDSGILK